MSGMEPRFIISSPRSGSTWLQNILSNLPSVICVESRAYGNFFELWPDADGVRRPRMTVDAFADILSKYINVRGMGSVTREAFTRVCTKAMVDAIHRAVREASGSTYVVEKVTPYLGTSAKVLHDVQRDFPCSPIVQLIRDGRDVVTSGVFHWINRNAQGTARYRYLVKNKRGRMRRFFDDEELRKWCKYWREPIEAFRAQGDEFPVLRFESLKAESESCIKELVGYLSLPEFSDDGVFEACQHSSFKRMSGGRESGNAAATSHVRKGVVGDWVNYFTKRDGEIFLAETNGLLEQHGYASDDSWVKSLPESLDVRVESRSAFRKLFRI